MPANRLPRNVFASVKSSMLKLRSSWSTDRIAASCCNRRHSKKNGSCPSALYAEYKLNAAEVTVFTRRRRVVFTRRFDGAISSACVRGDVLEVETETGGRYVCDAQTGELLEEWPSLETAAATVEANASAIAPSVAGITTAA